MAIVDSAEQRLQTKAAGGGGLSGDFATEVKSFLMVMVPVMEAGSRKQKRSSWSHSFDSLICRKPEGGTGGQTQLPSRSLLCCRGLNFMTFSA